MHTRPISRVPRPCQQGQTTSIETLIILVITLFFRDWDNFQSVIQNLSKYYSKTPG